MKVETLFGIDDSHTVEWNVKIRIHQEVQDPLQKLVAQARHAGIEIEIVSGYRSFDRQCVIWNEKCLGKRALLDAQGHPINIDPLKDDELVFHILRWSALPGASRHHWGTDIDIYDRRAVPRDYSVQLVPDEKEKYFRSLDLWLQKNLRNHQFWRPYLTDRKGISPEWWHLSYQPTAQLFEKELTIERLKDQIETSNLEKKAVVLKNLKEIYQRYIENVDPY